MRRKVLNILFIWFAAGNALRAQSSNLNSLAEAYAPASFGQLYELLPYKAFRTGIDLPSGQWLSRAMQRAFGTAPVKIRTAGGSIPISPFVTTLGTPTVSVPTVNPHNNQHSPTEHIRPGNYFDGVKTILAILTEPFQP